LALNYLYFDVAWCGVPLVHNASYVKDLGFYYEGQDTQGAIKYLEEAKTIGEEYKIKSRKVISKYLFDHPDNVEGYKKLILALDD
jgi:hypothetical protein